MQNTINDKRGGKTFAPPDLLVADLDGTLTQVSAVTAQIASVSDRWEMSAATAAMWAYEQFRRACNASGVSPKKLEVFKANMMSMLTKEQEDTYLLLSAAAQSNIPCRILSNGPKKWGEYIIRRMGVDPLVDKAVFREDVENLKPDPRSLRTVIADFRSRQQTAKIWIYGDRKSDVLLAWNAAKAFPQQFLPVAVAGTKAAATIEAANQNTPDSPSFGAVFSTQYDMARAINPAFDDKLKAYIRLRDKNNGIIDSRPSP